MNTELVTQPHNCLDEVMQLNEEFKIIVCTCGRVYSDFCWIRRNFCKTEEEYNDYQRRVQLYLAKRRELN